MGKSTEKYKAYRSGWVVGADGGLLKLILKDNGYLHFSQSEGHGKPNQTLVHRFVYEFFKGPIPDGMTIDHIDGDKLNNDIDNLQLMSRGDNSRKANRKLTEEDILSIKTLLSQGIKSRSIATNFNISEQTICDIKKGRIWSNIKEETN